MGAAFSERNVPGGSTAAKPAEPNNSQELLAEGAVGWAENRWLCAGAECWRVENA